jgi:hypothetical protein
MGEEQVEHEIGGLSFAITLLAALGTIIYVAYSYLQTTPVDPLRYFFISGLIPVGIILIIILLFYILIQGYSIEVDDPDHKKKLKARAKTIYLIVFPSFIALLIWLFCLFVLVSIKNTYGFGENWFKLLLGLPCMAIAWIGAYIVFGNFLQDWKAKRIEESKTKWQKRVWSFILLVYILGVLIMVWFVVFQFVPESRLLQGHISLDMESVYCKNDVPMPALIHVTGPNTNITVYLVNESNSLRDIDNITLYPEYPSYHTSHGKYLFGNTVEYGRYAVFINTTDLTPGYYELHCERWLSWKTSGGRSFYLVNSSQHSVIEELNTS